MSNRLTSKQRAHLRGLAHDLKPVAQIGKEGLSDGAVDGLLQLFSNRELIKVRVLEAAPDDAKSVGPALAEKIPGVQVVQSMGRVLTLYRAHPENPEIDLERVRSKG